MGDGAEDYGLFEAWSPGECGEAIAGWVANDDAANELTEVIVTKPEAVHCYNA